MSDDYNYAIPIVVLAFFLIALGIVFIAVLSKAYKNWKD